MAKFVALNDALAEYLLKHRTPDDEVLQALREETARMGERAVMQIAPDQGTFLNLLASVTGARRAVDRSLLGLSVEVWFQPTHHGRPLFADVDAYLRRNGFALFDLRELNRWRRKTDGGPDWTTWVGSGQLTFANALYFRDLPAAVMAALMQPEGCELRELVVTGPDEPSWP